MKQQQNIHPSSQKQTVHHMSGRFKQKFEAENKAVAHQKKMKEREKLRQEKVVQEKGLHNPFIKPAFGLGLLGTILVLFPAGIENQMQWWYLIPTFLCGIMGYVINYKARKLNADHYRRYRASVQPSLMKAGLYLSAFTLFGAMIMITTVLPIYFQ